MESLGPQDPESNDSFTCLSEFWPSLPFLIPRPPQEAPRGRSGGLVFGRSPPPLRFYRFFQGGGRGLGWLGLHRFAQRHCLAALEGKRCKAVGWSDLHYDFAWQPWRLRGARLCPSRREGSADSFRYDTAAIGVCGFGPQAR